MGKTGKKRSKVQMPAGIRNKMMAALSMLMVSCIMLVSSTYAWFTLSTAPEITGITTNVGANGNLEMMLLNAESYASTADNLGVDSKVGDSSAKQAVTLANETWGNLVDLSSDSYGLSSVMLMPSKLKLTDETGNVIAGNILNTPTYGKDGRVISVENTAMTGKYNSSWVYDATAVGVRALGTSSGTTLRLNEYTDALFYMGDFAGKAQTTARESLTQNAQPLANLIIDKALDATSFDVSYLDNIENIITGTSAANTHVESVIRYALLAWNLSDEGAPKDDQGAKIDLSDDQVKSIKDAIMSDTFDVTNIPNNITVPDSIRAIINVYEKTKTALTNANTKLGTLKAQNKESITWEEVTGVLGGLVDTNKVAVSSKEYTLKDYSSRAVGKEQLMSAIADDVMGSDAIPLPITMLEDSGVYYDIAKICGQYTVNGKVNVTYGGIFNNYPVDFKMTQSVEGDILVTAAITYIQTSGKAPEVNLEGGNSTIALSDTYGYMLDFGFRTNAAGSNLLLQTAEKQRVYSMGEGASTSTATQGGGSYMEFTTANPTAFSVDEMRALMSAIRVAFVKPNVSGTGTTYELLALGGLDITASDTDNDGLVTYTGGTPSGNDTLKANLVLFNHSYDATNATIKKGEKLVETTTGADGTTTTTTPVTTITRLDQNVAAKVSVIVYLDGTIVDNTMVANANTSMSGKLNLQFSSDATLVPMANSGMKAGGLQAQDAPAPDYGEPIQNLNKVVEFGGKSYSVAVAEGYSVYKADNNNYYYKANGSEQYIQINIDDYTVLSSCPAFTVTEVT